ncbi:SDR family NAD(P)-dependent oxidoreductase [Tsuneonella mangrovi]|uniref:SDR family NAD(P)-dependent oxidoreductase n=1 Tax=Tsuneonella mangrovi TaxID=1982042 RepID=UPI000BA2A530|nr:SDR family NAD(P)-dependent oxidoreductase [Tsuneonella mangrovi]
MADFSGKVAVITGGASGIGLAIARYLVDAGGAVVLADLPGERLDEAASALGDAALAVPTDVTKPEQIESLADVAFGWRGRVDLLLNNAGVGGPRGKQWEVDPDVARRHFDVNFWSVWEGCRVFAPRMAAQDHPSAIYNTASENAFFCAVPQSGAYIAAKHAVLGMTESLREDVPDHVSVGTLIPGWVATAIGPEQVMKYGMDADRFASIVVPQMLAGERFSVGHAYNVVPVHERIDALDAAFAKFAPRYEGDDEYDVRTVIARANAGRGGGGS